MAIYYDTETTGLKPGQICQLTYVVEDNKEKKIIKAFNQFFRVDSMTQGAESVHKFSLEKLKELSGGVRFGDLASLIYSDFKGQETVAHNASFDSRFLRAELERAGYGLDVKREYCTMKLFKDVLKIPSNQKASAYGAYKNPSLGELVKGMKIDENRVIQYSKALFASNDITFHDSRFDTIAMYVAFQVYRDKLNNTDKWRSIFCKE